MSLPIEILAPGTSEVTTSTWNVLGAGESLNLFLFPTTGLFVHPFSVVYIQFRKPDGGGVNVHQLCGSGEITRTFYGNIEWKIYRPLQSVESNGCGVARG